MLKRRKTKGRHHVTPLPGRDHTLLMKFEQPDRL